MSILETEYNEKTYGKTRYDEGVQAGIVQGIKKGLKQGLEQGKQSEKIATILRMIAKNVPIELIAEYTDISVPEITRLLKSNNNHFI